MDGQRMTNTDPMTLQLTFSFGPGELFLNVSADGSHLECTKGHQIQFCKGTKDHSIKILSQLALHFQRRSCQSRFPEKDNSASGYRRNSWDILGRPDNRKRSQDILDCNGNTFLSSEEILTREDFFVFNIRNCQDLSRLFK